MRQIPALMQDIINAGPPFFGDTKPCTRITVEPDWYLNVANGISNYPVNKQPVRWYQDAANDQTEIELENVKTVIIDRQLTQDAATIEVDFWNSYTPPNGQMGSQPDTFGEPGWYSWARGQSPDAQARWNQQANQWSNILRENALLRIYQGYGGWGVPLEEAIANGNIMLTGVFLVDSVALEAQTGLGKLTGRDMAKLVIDQYSWPPLVPTSFYTSIGINYYHDTDDTYPQISVYGNGTYATDGEVSAPSVTDEEVCDFAIATDGTGYRICGSDGGVFCYGDTSFLGSLAGQPLNGGIIAMDALPNGQGYWLCGTDGGVFTFGDAGFYGSINSIGATLDGYIVAFRATSTGLGYWMVDEAGQVFSFGDAAFHGNATGITSPIIDFTPRPQGDGYWMLTRTGSVYSLGAAAYHSDFNSLSAGTKGSRYATGIDASATGGGYRICTDDAAVYCFGDADAYAATSTIPSPLNAPATGIRHLPGDTGYIVVAADGGIFTYGSLSAGSSTIFDGSLPASFTVDVSGNYSDYADIVSDFLLWSGFWLGNSEGPAVFGNIETTGAYNVLGPLDPSTFDKLQVIDCIKTIRDIVGYIFRVDNTGAARFESPNWWSSGNFLDDGTPTNEIPLLDEKLNITDYIQTTSDQTLVSEIIVASSDPYLFDNAASNVTAGNGDTTNSAQIASLQAQLAVANTNYTNLEASIAANPTGDGTGGDGGSTTDPLATDPQTLQLEAAEAAITQLENQISYLSVAGTITYGPPDQTVTRFIPPNIASLHGLCKPAMLGIPLNVPVTIQDQENMAELLALQCWFAARQGQVTSLVNPAIDLDTQVRIMERSSGEANIHYIVGVHTEHDIDAGTWLATYTTYWLGDRDNWAITTEDSYFAGSAGGGGSLETTSYDDNGFPITSQLQTFLANTGSAKTRTFNTFRVDSFKES